MLTSQPYPVRCSMRTLTNRRARAQPVSQSATAHASASATPNLRVNARSLRVLSVIVGMMSGFPQPFISGLINMSVYVFTLSTSAYTNSNLAATSNFCIYTDSLVFWMYAFVYFGTITGLIVGEWLCGLNLIIGPVLVATGAVVCAHFPYLGLHAFMYLMIGLGGGIVREAVPIHFIQISPEGERHTLDVLFDMSNLFGGVIANLINFIIFIFRYFTKLWWVGFYALVCFACFILLASLKMRIRGNEPRRPQIGGSVTRGVLTKLQMAIVPHFIALDLLVFFAPSVLESFGVWVGNTFILVLVASIIVFSAHLLF
ncbi:PREDICTED: sugar carrier protein A-like [Ipomoea nil]|uniref:sugar carrier protein A-like n=1 Tax=Ipomoea nil TaxID=35883 RepID=UPI00090190F3|nr:PREDICTED: sugar carrier protein A-like [Ipomoea nil]